MTVLTIFSVQDETGTVYQLTAAPSPPFTYAVGDTGVYTGTPDAGTDGFEVPPEVSTPFTVSQTGPDATQFSIRTTQQALAWYARSGTIEWTSGANNGDVTTIVSIAPANAYISIAEYQAYWATRNVDKTAQDAAAVRAAIVQASDYLDQRYRYNGVKLVQNVGKSMIDANAVFLQPWLFPGSILNIMNPLTPYTTPQNSQWPRQGVVDLNGSTVNGIPQAIKQACAELASRVMAGTNLQPDYDPDVVTNGAVVSQITKKVGPLEKSITYDTKLGLGFFPSFPQITRMLRSAGLLSSQGRRTVMR